MSEPIDIGIAIDRRRWRESARWASRRADLAEKLADELLRALSLRDHPAAFSAALDRVEEAQRLVKANQKAAIASLRAEGILR